MNDTHSPQDILRFWFEEIPPARWWKVDPDFDRLIDQRFGVLHDQAVQAELAPWRSSPEGRLAEVILLDQFSRNRFRGHPRAFAADGMALVLAQEALDRGADMALDSGRRLFFYMPYMHSESRAIHAVAAPLFEARAPGDNHRFELRHKAIIDHFGRYPHRNAILGRASTAEELAFLQEPGSSF